MLINNNSDTTNNETELFADGVICLQTKQYLFAYSVFSNLSKSSKSATVAVLYNMALCYYFAKEYQKAIEMLDKAIQKTAIPSTATQQFTGVPQLLIAQEFENNSHHFALTESASTCNSTYVKLRIRRLLVDLNLHLENWQEVIRLSQLSDMDKCKNVVEAVEIAKNKSTI